MKGEKSARPIPAGNPIGYEEGGLRLGDRVFPWASLSIGRVELAEFTSQRTTIYTIERLLINGPAGRVILDPAMIRNGRLITDNVWSHLRGAHP